MTYCKCFKVIVDVIQDPVPCEGHQSSCYHLCRFVGNKSFIPVDAWPTKECIELIKNNS